MVGLEFFVLFEMEMYKKENKCIYMESPQFYSDVLQGYILLNCAQKI